MVSIATDEGRVRLTCPAILLVHDRQMRKHIRTCTYPLPPPPTLPSPAFAEIVAPLLNMKPHVCVVVVELFLHLLPPHIQPLWPYMYMYLTNKG